ncbi:MAG: hypothetical protein MZV49_19815 [Rhodopseudomonas palustris]|nr:hypothetical protein [Rhodopseudomonas palustris]
MPVLLVLAESDPQMLPAIPGSGQSLSFLIRMPVFRYEESEGFAGRKRFELLLLRWQEEQDQHEREKKSEMIEHIFKEYKSERGKEVRKSG